jgi:precorrin-3B methylase
MFTYETADQKEVRRFRIAQFNGRTATIKSGDTTITGLVRSVLEQESSVPPRWIITIIPIVPKAKTAALRPSPRVRSFADDYC